MRALFGFWALLFVRTLVFLTEVFFWETDLKGVRGFFIGTFLITYQFDKSGDFGILVNFATSISFLIAPIIAIFNYLVVNRYLDNKFVPPKWLNYLSIIGVLYFTKVLSEQKLLPVFINNTKFIISNTININQI